MKKIIMAGINAVYILESGFTKGLWYNSSDESAIPRKRYFDDVSLAFAHEAGVAVHTLNNDGTAHEIGKKHTVISTNKDRDNNTYAMAMTENDQCIKTIEEYTPAMNDQKADALRTKFQDSPDGLRYRLMIDPLSNLLAYCAKEGLTIKDGKTYISEIPTSRCIVNAVGAGITHFGIPDIAAVSEKSKKALKALELLQKKGIIQLSIIPNEKIETFIS